MAHKGAMGMFEEPKRNQETPDVDDLIFDEEVPCSER